MENANFSQDELEKAYVSILSSLGDAYLLKVGEESVKDTLAKEGKTYEQGSQLYGAQAMALKELLNEEMSLMGLSLPEEVAKNGEVFDELNFSNYEKRILENKVANLGFFVQIISENMKNN